MTLQDCYAALGGDYANARARLRSDRLVEKFVLKFLNDKSYELFLSSMANKDYDEAFRAAHTIKGVCQNLSFSRLLESSSLMSDALRNGYTPAADELTERLGTDYNNTIDAIKRYKTECEGN